MMQMVQIRFTDAALADVAHIREHIGRENPTAATRVAVQIVSACDRLEYLPERGRPGLRTGTRELVVMSTYIVIYRIEAETVMILRVWHGAQDQG